MVVGGVGSVSYWEAVVCQKTSWHKRIRGCFTFVTLGNRAASGINAGKTSTIPFTSLYTKIITDKNSLINVTVKGDGVILNKGSWNVKTEWWRKSKKIGGVSHDHFDVTLKMK
jgi:hypothetical protein